MGNVNGLWGLIVLVADVWAIVNIFQSRAETGSRGLIFLSCLAYP